MMLLCGMALLCSTGLVLTALAQSNKLVVVDNEGNVHVTGPHAGELEIGDSLFVPHEPAERWAFVAKLSGSGEVMWARQFPGSGYTADGINGLAVDDDGNGYISGAFRGMGELDGLDTPTAGTMIIKYNPDGRFEWTERLHSYPLDVTMDTNGRVRAVGSDLNGGPAATIAIDRWGTTLWQNRAGTGRNSLMWAVSASRDGHVSQIGFFGFTSFVRHEDAVGNEVWMRLIEGVGAGGGSRIMSVDVDSAGNTIVAGAYAGTLRFEIDHHLTGGTHFLAMYDPFGNVMWADNLPDMDVGNHLTSLVVDETGQIHTAATVFDFSRDGSIGILLTGYVPGVGQSYSRYLDNVWTGSYAANVLDVHRGKLYLAAYARNADYIADMTLLLNAPASHFFVGRFDLQTQVSRVGPAELPRTARLFAPHPNPVASRGVVPFETNTTTPVDIRVYDVLGREVMVLMDATVPAGRHEVRFNRGALPGGVYVIRLITPTGTDTAPVTVINK